MKQIQAILVSLGALVSAIPGYASIQTGMGTPPDRGALFGGVQIALSSLVLLGILFNREEITQINRRRLTLISAGCAAMFLVGLLLYAMLLDLCVVRQQNETPPDSKQVFYFPIVPGGELAKAIDQSSRQEVADRYRRHLPQLLDEQGIRLTATTGILLFLYVLTYASLVGAFAFLSVGIGVRETEPPASEITHSGHLS